MNIITQAGRFFKRVETYFLHFLQIFPKVDTGNPLRGGGDLAELSADRRKKAGTARRLSLPGKSESVCRRAHCRRLAAIPKDCGNAGGFTVALCGESDQSCSVCAVTFSPRFLNRHSTVSTNSMQ